MSFTWRYVVCCDGSFCRVGNINGRLDHVSDEELARLHPTDPDQDEQPVRLDRHDLTLGRSRVSIYGGPK